MEEREKKDIKKEEKENNREDKPAQRMIASSEAGGFIREADIIYYKGMGQRCDEIQEIMGRTPVWLRKGGFILLAAVAAGFICLVWFLRVPQTMEVTFSERDSGASIPVVATHDGHIAGIAVANGSEVTQGDTLVLILSAETTLALTAPQDGTVAYTAPLTRNRAATAGRTLLHIIPRAKNPADGPLYGYLTPQQARGVAAGMEVLLDNGARGRVTYVSPVAGDSGEFYFEAGIHGATPDRDHRPTSGKIIVSDERLITTLLRSWKR